MTRIVSALLTAALFAGTAAAQSLAEVARMEKARRREVKSSAPVITNKDLKPARQITSPPPPPVAAASDDPTAAQPLAPALPEDGLLDEKDEQVWRQKMADARLALERSQMYHDALQSKINALWAEFTARDDPAQRAQIELERQRAIAESERVEAEITARQKAISDLEEEARRAGVPPGWLR
jgi:hypothetical protein